mgnify:FL=1
MKNALLSIYTEMMLSIHTGSINGTAALSKPLYITSIIEAIEWDALTENEIMISNEFIRKRFGQLYEQVNGNRKGYEVSFFVRPFFHLSSASFYHLIWKQGVEPSKKAYTPSAKYLRENLLYAKLDDELWELLQDAESREYIKQNIIRRYLTK